MSSTPDMVQYILFIMNYLLDLQLHTGPLWHCLDATPADPSMSYLLFYIVSIQTILSPLIVDSLQLCHARCRRLFNYTPHNCIVGHLAAWLLALTCSLLALCAQQCFISLLGVLTIHATSYYTKCPQDSLVTKILVCRADHGFRNSL